MISKQITSTQVYLLPGRAFITPSANSSDLRPWRSPVSTRSLHGMRVVHGRVSSPQLLCRRFAASPSPRDGRVEVWISLALLRIGHLVLPRPRRLEPVQGLLYEHPIPNIDPVKLWDDKRAVRPDTIQPPALLSHVQTLTSMRLGFFCRAIWQLLTWRRMYSSELVVTAMQRRGTKIPDAFNCSQWFIRSMRSWALILGGRSTEQKERSSRSSNLSFSVSQENAVGWFPGLDFCSEGATCTAVGTRVGGWGGIGGGGRSWPDMRQRF